MFNFHKPRTYRSTEGCCICKAKSSSSRFTDSRKYERDIMQCFDLKYPRQGEICNACVLLVKRFKRLPVGSKRNWSHIVDAKAGVGPGYNKIQTKYKSERINSKAAAQQQQQQQGNVSASLSTNNSCSSTGNVAGSNNALNNMFFIPEKFSKIFKKSKRLKDATSQSSKRKLATNGWSQSNPHSLPTTPDSLDSDYEDARVNSSLSSNPGSTAVQFQTQTRASAFKAQAEAEAKKRRIKLGTKRRKCLPPQKYRRSIKYEETLQFFNEEEWSERKSCCGMFYECASLAGALLIDTSNYKPCEKHQQRGLKCQQNKTEAATAKIGGSTQKTTTPLSLPKPILQTVPAVVQLQPIQSLLPSSVSSNVQHSFSSSATNNSFKTAMTTTTTPTPVLKKHHLFYKRQSECFPQGDMVTTTNNTNNDTKTELEKHQDQHHHHDQIAQQQQQQQQYSSSTTSQRHIENAINANSLTNSPNTILTNTLTTLPLSISVTSSSAAASFSAPISTMPQMPKHSLAKVTTISPPLTTSIQHTHYHPYANSTSNSTMMPLAKPNSFVHKLKADSGKIVKHSLEKFNTAVRLKTSDINEMKPIIRTVDKSYIIAKPPTQANIVSLNATTIATSNYQTLASYNVAAQPPLTTATLSAASPTSSTSSTSSTKFSDNSSDSGFDENMLDRKSASPLQEDCEKKLSSRSGVQTMFLASGVQIQGQSQNLILTGNEVAAKILQNRKYSTSANPITNARSLNSSNHQPTTTAVKIAQISTTPLTTSTSSATSSVGPPMSMSSAAQAKMRAIYNNNNTIQHENGITTILPASSLAASTQTAAMQNIAPSTVTITPAPPLGTQFNPQNVISRKFTTANIINLHSNTANLSNSNNNPSGNHHHINCNSSSSNSSCSSSINNNNHSNMTNQKIILLKTSPNNATTVSANYNAITGGGGGHHGSSGGGR